MRHDTRRSDNARPGIFLSLFAGFALVLAGCGGADMGMSPGGPAGPGGGGVGGNPGGGGGLGATPGGAQDFRQIRKTIASGQVPQATNFYVEGLLSEHDLPLEGAPCTELLCLQLAAGVAQTRFSVDTAGSSPARPTLVQVGFSSGLSAETFRRAPQNLALVVDISGSMQGSKMSDTRTALNKLVDRLDEGDVVSIVAFNSKASLRLGPTNGGDTARIKAAIAGLQAGGSTNIEAGLKLGYAQIESRLESGTRSARLMLFTDARPNVGNTSAGGFIPLVTQAANKNIGLSAFGVGIDFQAQLIDAIANLRGGNYFYLADSDAIRTVFDKDFDYLVTPLAYGLELELTIAPGFRFVAAHGVKAWESGKETSTVRVPTIFLSRNKGAMLVELEQVGTAPTSGAVPILSARLAYEMPDGRTVSGDLAVSLPDTAFSGKDAAYSQPAVQKTVALVMAVHGMQEACKRYWEKDPDAARGILAAVAQALDAHAAALNDQALRDEADLVRKLRTNML